MHFDQEFFVALATLLFFVATFKPMKKALFGMLDGKINSISREIDEAAALRAEAERLLKEAQEKLVQSEKSAQEIIKHAKREADIIISNAKDKLGRDIEVRKKLAMQKIQSFEENAITELRKNIAQITVAAAEQIIEENSEDDGFKKSVGSSIEKLSKTIH